MSKLQPGELREAVCPKCGGNHFRIIAGRRPSKIKEFDNGYPFNVYECSKEGCGWSTLPYTDYEEMDKIVSGLFYGELPKEGALDFRVLSIASDIKRSKEVG